MTNSTENHVHYKIKIHELTNSIFRTESIFDWKNASPFQIIWSRDRPFVLLALGGEIHSLDPRFWTEKPKNESKSQWVKIDVGRRIVVVRVNPGWLGISFGLNNSGSIHNIPAYREGGWRIVRLVPHPTLGNGEKIEKRPPKCQPFDKIRVFRKDPPISRYGVYPQLWPVESGDNFNWISWLWPWG